MISQAWDELHALLDLLAPFLVLLLGQLHQLLLYLLTFCPIRFVVQVQPWTNPEQFLSFQISQFCILICVKILLTNIDKRRDQQTYGFQTIPLCIWYVRGILVDKLENRGSPQYLARCPQQPRLHFHFYQVLNLYTSFIQLWKLIFSQFGRILS